MNSASRILFPAAVVATVFFGASGLGRDRVEVVKIPSPFASADTVVYPSDGYRQRRTAEQIAEFALTDLLSFSAPSDSTYFEEDTLQFISARDTIRVPDSLRLTDPFRFKYYIALVDSFTHVLVSDSLKVSFKTKIASGDSLSARADSLDWRRLDSVWCADSVLAAKAKFAAWYASLSKSERKKYDLERKMEAKLAAADSLDEIKENKKAERDSIIENTPRILQTFAVDDSMQYKRIISWTVDQDFHKMKVEIPDTGYNYHFYDYPFLRKDVNATWLGVAGSPVQSYDFFKRTSESDVEFYKALESWSYGPGSLEQVNTKTPFTELAYYGTILGGSDKESDNLHIYTTQNITPALNVGLQFDRFGGGGMLANEETKNKTFSFKTNYLGKRYLMNAGYISNTVEREDNGGVVSISEVSDTVLDAREMAINLRVAESKTTRHTVFLNQQLRIPFNFINEIRARRDSSFSFDKDAVDRNITTAFIGHSSELSTYARIYEDAITSRVDSSFYRNVFNYGAISSDSVRVLCLDNKVFIKLQPWSDQSIVSKLNIGIGDRYRSYYVQTDADPKIGSKVNENSFYGYAGAEGSVKKYFGWNAKARLTFLGADAGDFAIEGNAAFNLYPFRKAKTSPIAFKAHFETSLKNPSYYEKHVRSNHFLWNHDEFTKISTTKLQAEVDIPWWKLKAGAGYALLAGNLYYGNDATIRQNTTAMSVFSASLIKNFKIGPLRLDNKLLFQSSSDQSAVPVPALALNLRYYLEFVVQKDAAKRYNVMTMQLGVNGFWNTAWNSPSWNPNLGVFYNQTDRKYNNGPYFDVFLNVQWQRCCIFIKYQNATAGLRWPVRSQDYFSADRQIITQNGLGGLKIGIYWPFYIQPRSGTAGTAMTRE